MTRKILPVLAALTALTVASARTPEQFVDAGSGQGGSSFMTAQFNPTLLAFSASVPRRFFRSFQLRANRSNVVFEAKAPAWFSVASLNVQANDGTLHLLGSEESWLHAGSDAQLNAE